MVALIPVPPQILNSVLSAQLLRQVFFFFLLQTAERERCDKTGRYQSSIAEAGLHLDHS